MAALGAPPTDRIEEAANEALAGLNALSRGAHAVRGGGVKVDVVDQIRRGHPPTG